MIKPPSPSPEALKETLEENDKKLERSLASRNAVAAEPLDAKLMNMLNPVGNIMRSPGEQGNANGNEPNEDT